MASGQTNQPGHVPEPHTGLTPQEEDAMLSNLKKEMSDLYKEQHDGRRIPPGSTAAVAASAYGNAVVGIARERQEGTGHRVHPEELDQAVPMAPKADLQQAAELLHKAAEHAAEEDLDLTGKVRTRHAAGYLEKAEEKFDMAMQAQEEYEMNVQAEETAGGMAGDRSPLEP